MDVNDALLGEWWGRLQEGQRQHLEISAKAGELDDETQNLLQAMTPTVGMSGVTTVGDGTGEHAPRWNPLVREFAVAQANNSLRAWWYARSDVEQDMLRAEKDASPLPAQVVVLLIETKCPSIPVGARWETSSDPGFAFHMPEELAELIERLDDSTDAV